MARILDSSISYQPLTAERWEDFEVLFGQRGACAGCWCMWWRLRRSTFDAQKGEPNRQELKAIVSSGEVPGILAYKDGQAIGWCSVEPREAFPALERSRLLARVDDQPVWSIVCFFVQKSYRRQGLTVGLLLAVIDYAQQAGARILEGYPEDTQGNTLPAPFVYTGLVSAFQEAGFIEVLRRSPKRPIMRYHIDMPAGEKSA